MSPIFCPRFIPKKTIPTKTVINMDVVGFPINSNVVRMSDPSAKKKVLSVPIPIKITGVSAIIKLVKKEGISASLNVLLSNKPLGGFATIFFINSGNTIPAASKAGIATTIPV